MEPLGLVGNALVFVGHIRLIALGLSVIFNQLDKSNFSEKSLVYCPLSKSDSWYIRKCAVGM